MLGAVVDWISAWVIWGCRAGIVVRMKGWSHLETFCGGETVESLRWE